MASTADYNIPTSETYVPMRTLPAPAGYKPGDVLVVFGELFTRGYANGIVDEAEKAGLTVVRSTVGRRDSDGNLRALTAEEASAQAKPFINIPMEAGFDMEPAQDGTSPVEQLKSVKMSEWDKVSLDWAKVEDSRKRGVARFRKHLENYLKELDQYIPKGANVIFVHTMAGGVPRAKILMPTMNKVFKGVGERHLSSETFWRSDLGRLSEQNFEEVTANTLQHLIEMSSALRSRIERDGGSARYVAYGYHGTEVLIHGKYEWQSYAPYVQGWAKMKLEDIAKAAWKKEIKATVFNCPEILTNSSSIFQGVEIPLYPWLAALKKEGAQSGKAKALVNRALALLKPEYKYEDMMALTDEVLSSPAIKRQSNYDQWPQHNAQEQMEVLIKGSDRLVEMHKDQKDLITFVLSEEVFRATGYVMYNESWKPRAPVFWLGHDILAQALATEKTL